MGAAVLKMDDYRKWEEVVANPMTETGGLQPGLQPVCNQVERDWITFEQAQELLGISRQAIQKAIDKNRYTARQVVSEKGGRGGIRWQIHAASLPEAARTAWYSRCPEAVNTPQQLAEGLADKFIGVDGVAKRLSKALWIYQLIKPALAAAPRSTERAQIIAKIIQHTRQRWDGKETVKEPPQRV